MQQQPNLRLVSDSVLSAPDLLTAGPALAVKPASSTVGKGATFTVTLPLRWRRGQRARV